MKNKINIARLLKDCPKGMELDCTMYEDVTLIHVLEGCTYPIKLETPDGQLSLNKCGQYSNNKFAKCVIFPKGKTTWEGFQRPFKDGDVVVAEDDECFQLFLLKDLTYSEDYNSYNGYCYFGWNFQCNKLFEKGKWRFNRLATEEEKQKLFDAIKANGFKWNAETKTLEKLIIPKFKVGDKIVKRNSISNPWIISSVSSEYYGLKLSKGSEDIGVLTVSEQDEWELVPNKFDITTLKPFDNCKYSLDGGITWKYAQYWFIQEKYNTNDIDIELWQG